MARFFRQPVVRGLPVLLRCASLILTVEFLAAGGLRYAAEYLDTREVPPEA